MILIRVLTTYFNSPNYIPRTIESLKIQKIKDWKCYITNDLSDDGSISLVEDLIRDDARFVLINNTQKMWQTGNYYQVVHRDEIKDNDICVTVDGDDWLPDEKVFNRVLDYYNDGNTWMTFGQFKFYSGPDKPVKAGFTKRPEPFEDVRKLPWTSSHLRTFKAFLLRKVKKEDLFKPDKSGFLEMAGDVACFSPCMEMSGRERVKYVDDVNYVYNDETPLNESKVNVAYSTNCALYIASLPKYERL